MESKHQESLCGGDEDVSGGSGQRFCSNGKGLAGSPPSNELFELWRSESQRSTGAAKLFAVCLEVLEVLDVLDELSPGNTRL